jgi:hypothetical protein
MMGLEQIIAMNRAAARRSAREHILPLVVSREDLETDLMLKRRLRAIPFIGDRRPRGWKRMDASALLGSDRGCVPWSGPEKNHFIEVDSSGFGTPGEIALTFEEFLEAVRKIGPGYGYAMVEQGQFQVVVGVFRPREQS